MTVRGWKSGRRGRAWLAAVVGVIAIGTAAFAFTWGSASSATAPTSAKDVHLTDADSVQSALATAFERHISAAVTTTDFALLDGVTRLSAADVAAANGVYSTFTMAENEHVKVFVGFDADPVRDGSYCGPVSVTIPLCQESTSDAGTVVEQVRVTRRAPAEYGDNAFMTLDTSATLSASDYPDLRLEHVVASYRTDGSVTRVTDTLSGPTSLEVDEAFAITTDALDALASDPAVAWTRLALREG